MNIQDIRYKKVQRNTTEILCNPTVTELNAMLQNHTTTHRKCYGN